MIQHYGHPFLRWTVDYLTAKAFTLIESEVVVEVAGKIHKNLRMTDKKFLNYRPKLFGLDFRYWSTHEKLIEEAREEGKLIMYDRKVDKNFVPTEHMSLLK